MTASSNRSYHIGKANCNDWYGRIVKPKPTRPLSFFGVSGFAVNKPSGALKRLSELA